MKRFGFGKRAAVAIVSLAVVTGLASAQAPSMPTIDFPLDTASVVAVTVAAGVILLTLVYPVKIGFSFLHRLVARLTGTM